MYYVYAYLDPLKPGEWLYDGNIKFDYQPIYIGKGKDDRCYDHLKETSNVIFTNKINYWKRNDITHIIIKLAENISESDAYAIEKSYIKSIGRLDQGLGPLLNLTDGGDGPAGRVPRNKGKKIGSYLTESGRIKISSANKDKMVSDETKNKIREANLNKPKSIEHREKLSKANKGKASPNKGKTGIWSEDQLLAASAKRKTWWTTEQRERHGNKFAGKKLSDEHRKRISDGQRGRRQSEETKRIMSEKRKEYWLKRKSNDGKNRSG
jgi:NUMOD3 motif